MQTNYVDELLDVVVTTKGYDDTGVGLVASSTCCSSTCCFHISFK